MKSVKDLLKMGKPKQRILQRIKFFEVEWERTFHKECPEKDKLKRLDEIEDKIFNLKVLLDTTPFKEN